MRMASFLCLSDQRNFIGNIFTKFRYEQDHNIPDVLGIVNTPSVKYTK